jgi:hypothetical protein
MSETVIDVFGALVQRPPSDESIISKASPKNSLVFLGVDKNRDFLVMFKDDDGPARPNRKLRFLSVDYGMIYKTLEEGSSESGRYTCVRLQHANSEFLESFSRLAELLISEISPTAGSEEIRNIVDEFIELFTPKPGIPRDRIKGLFGELTIINSSGDDDELIRAWHEETNANKDFTFEDTFLEVKTCESDQRKHSVGANQLHDSQRVVFLASVTIQEDPSGVTVFELMDSIRTRANADNQSKLVRNVFDTLGMDAAEAEELRFSLLGGTDAIHVFAASDLPTVAPVANEHAAKAITNIHFDLNLTTAEASGVEFKSLENWFRSL